ncbi:MAG TPA: amino acid adenylation domain-containing protein, partial [Candidatus Deferrimicrobium sp.]|nr:amino acid adenylation domain-containing protein [Candidatus Deferrimicrobium sp.]
TLAAFENQEYPFENLVEKVVVNRDTGRNPLFDVIFVLQNIENVEIAIPGLLLKPYEYQNTISKFDLTFFAVEEGNRVVFTVEYCTALFKEETIKRFITYFNKLLLSIIAEPDQKIGVINMLPEEEIKRILYDFNDTESEYPAHKTIQELFTGQVEKVPDSIALVGAALRDQRVCPNCLTYRELNEQSNRLAGLLIEKGVLPENIVGIKIERSLEMIIGILGILKSGGAYLPIALDFPRERIEYMLNDSGAKLLVTTDNNKEGEKVHLEEISKPPKNSSYLLTFLPSYLHNSSSLAYIIYTSGSTGKPKGVMVEHRNVTRVVRNTNYIELNTVDRILQLSNYAFDGSIFDIFGALLNGASLVMIRQGDVLAVNRLSKIIENQGITVFFITTALFNTLVDLKIECFRRIRKVLFGGERISVEHSRKALDYLGKGRIIHVYGPTETTVYASYYFIDAITGDSITIPIGKPIANTTIYILDKNRKPVPIGVPGEIYIGGAGVSRGYLNNPELTAEKIRRDDISDRFYKTGDLARWLADGNIEFSGRLDHQVKIRGFRIELSEIESRLLKYPGIKEAIVLVPEEEHEGKYICAYFVCDREYEISGLSEFLSKELPDYMIPSYFVPLEKIPLTANGKIDLKVLPKPDLKAGQDYVAPRNEIEVQLVALWGEVLNIKPGLISIDSNFFQLGGHSLKAAVLASRVHKELNVLLPLAELFKTPTIRGLSEYIKGKSEDIYESIMPVEEKEYYSLSSAQKRLFVLQQMESNSVSYNIPAAFILEGEPDPQRLTDTTRKMIQRHESFRTSFIMVNNEPVQRVHENVEFE